MILTSTAFDLRTDGR